MFWLGKTYKTFLGGGEEVVWESRLLNSEERRLEAPLDRVQRLQREVREALQGLSCFLVEEKPPASENKSADSDARGDEDDVAGQPRFSEKPLSRRAQEALLGGASALDLIGELKQLQAKVRVVRGHIVAVVRRGCCC